ncbi:MAG: DegV family protein, partial [Lachnospiraceae bacterium]|nr:DegV family protein [Lachnospiraceae bacterium]
EQLKKGGRITPVVAALGSAFNIKPILTLQGEKLDAYTKGRGIKQCEKKMIDAVEKDLQKKFENYVPRKIRIEVAGSFKDPQKAEIWKKEVQDAFPGYKISYTPLSCSIVSHVGMDAVGIGICGVLREE